MHTLLLLHTITIYSMVILPWSKKSFDYISGKILYQINEYIYYIKIHIHKNSKSYEQI